MPKRKESIRVGNSIQTIEITYFTSIKQARKSLSEEQILNLINYAYNLVQRSEARQKIKGEI